MSPGGYTTARAEVVGLLRQRSRPYLFSNTLAPSVAAAGIAVFDMLSSSHALRDKLQENTDYFRRQLTAAGFDIKPGNHPIVVGDHFGMPIQSDIMHCLQYKTSKSISASVVEVTSCCVQSGTCWALCGVLSYHYCC